MKSDPVVLTTGDRVLYKGDREWADGSHIIYKPLLNEDATVEYSTNRGAWFVREEFQFVSGSDQESLAELCKDVFGEDDED